MITKAWFAAAGDRTHNRTDQIIVRFSAPYADGRLKANGLSRQIGKHLEFVRETSLGSPVYDLQWHYHEPTGGMDAPGAWAQLDSADTPVRVLGQCGGYSSDIADIADGIRWAAGLSVDGETLAWPAQVINMSLGGSGSCAPDSEYQLAINDAVAQGTTVVVAAGNSNADAGNFAPASCANVVSVAATGRTGARAYVSVPGTKRVIPPMPKVIR